MRIVGRDKLNEFCLKHTGARRAVAAWVHESEGARWADSHAIKGRYASASFLPDNVVIFNLKGNAFRLEVMVAYKTGVVVVHWIGTHDEYGRRNAKR